MKLKFGIRGTSSITYSTHPPYAKCGKKPMDKKNRNQLNRKISHKLNLSANTENSHHANQLLVVPDNPHTFRSGSKSGPIWLAEHEGFERRTSITLCDERRTSITLCDKHPLWQFQGNLPVQIFICRDVHLGIVGCSL